MSGCPVTRLFCSERRLLALAGLLSVAFLAVALVSQYGFGLFPCELCIKQRVPYALIAIIALPVAMMKGVGAGVRRAVVWLCALLFLVDAGIAFYHTGVELHWFPGPSSCTASTEPQTLEEMRRAILEAELVSCDQPMAHVMGLSMAAWNGIAALGSGLLMLWGLCAIRCKAKKEAA